MNQHVDKAMELRNEMPMVNNCAQTIMRVYADELGMRGTGGSHRLPILAMA